MKESLGGKGRERTWRKGEVGKGEKGRGNWKAQERKLGEFKRRGTWRGGEERRKRRGNERKTLA